MHLAWNFKFPTTGTVELATLYDAITEYNLLQTYI